MTGGFTTPSTQLCTFCNPREQSCASYFPPPFLRGRKLPSPPRRTDFQIQQAVEKKKKLGTDGMDFKALRAFRVGGTYGTCALLAELRAGKMNSTSLARSVLVQKRF